MLNPLLLKGEYIMNKLSELRNQFDELLDCGGAINVDGLHCRQYLPSVILKRVDPTTYRCDFWEYVDALGIDSVDVEFDIPSLVE